MLQACLNKKGLHLEERSENLLLGIEFRKNLLLTLIRRHYPELSGAPLVPVKGKGKGKQITGTFSITASGKVLPMQLIYAGKTQRCHPKGIPFPDGFDLTHSTKTIGATKPWLSNTLITSSFHLWSNAWRARALRRLGLSSHLMFSKHKQQTSIVITLTRTTLCMYKYHQILPISPNFSISMLMHFQNNFWNRSFKNGTQKR